MIAYSSIAARRAISSHAFLGDGPGPVPGGRVLRARLRADERAGLRGAAARTRTTPRATGWITSRDCSAASPCAALMIGVAMLSLAGIPPFPGFIAKFTILQERDRGRIHGLCGALGAIGGLPAGFMSICASSNSCFMSAPSREAARRVRAGWRWARACAVLLCPGHPSVRVPGWFIGRS